MGHEMQLTAGFWWRFDRYQLKDGRIQPRRGARLQLYNPWADFQRSGEETALAAQEPPYISLLCLLKDFPELREVPTRAVSLSDGAESALLAWCAKHGLLGLLPHLVQVIELAPRRVRARWTSGSERVVCRYVRCAGGWSTELRNPDGGHHQVTDRHLRDFSKGRPVGHGMVIRSERLVDPALRLDGVEFCADYFPSVGAKHASTYCYPEPFRKSFWNSYAEPLDVFCGAARLLDRIIRDFFASSRKSPISILNVAGEPDSARLETSPRKAKAQKLDVRLRLEGLLAPSRRTLASHPKHGFQPLWDMPSLLSAYAVMFSDDLVRRRLLRCRECGRIFVSTFKKALYCGSKCRNTATKRVYRHKRRKREQAERDG